MHNTRVGTIDRSRHLPRLVTYVTAFVAITLACVLATTARGQAPGKSPQLSGDYYVASLDQLADPDKVKSLETQMRQALTNKGASSSAANGSKEATAYAAIKMYFNTYLWKKLSQPEAAPELTDLVYETLRNLERIEQSGSPALFKECLGWVRVSTTNVATRQAGGKYFSPSARVAATMILANLNLRGASNGAPPTPDVLGVGGALVQLVKDAEAPVGVRITALGGLRRHAHLIGPINDASVQRPKQFYVTTGKSLLEENGPAGLTSEALGRDPFAFVQRYAIDMISSAGTAEDKQWLAGKLNALVADQATSPIVAFYAAKKLADLGDAVQSLDVSTPTVVAWADRAIGSLDAEIERMKSFDKPKVVVAQQVLARIRQKRRPGAGGGGMGPGGMGGGMGPGGMGGGLGSGEGGYGDGPGGEGGYPGGEGGYPGGDEGGMGPGGGYGMGPGGYGGGLGGVSIKAQPVEVITARRALNTHLQGLILGMSGSLDPNRPGKGLATVAKEDAQERADELLATFRTLVDEVNQKSYDSRLKFITMLEEQREELADWIAQHKPEEAEPTEAGEEEAAEGDDPAEIASR